MVCAIGRALRAGGASAFFSVRARSVDAIGRCAGDVQAVCNGRVCARRISFGGDRGKDTSYYVKKAENAITTMVANISVITIKDDEQNFYATLLKEEYEKIYTDVVENTTPIINALNELPVYYRYHIKNELNLALGKDNIKIVRYRKYL
jgi:hypothetical protein